MESLIKKILKEYTETKIDELKHSGHFDDRFKQRVYVNEDYVVQKWTRVNNRIDIRNIGTYRINQLEYKTIEDRIKHIDSIDVDENLSIGVEIYRFNVDIDRVKYFTRDDRFETLRDTLKENSQTNIYLKTVSSTKDKKEESVGDVLFVIVKDNKAITTYLERSFNFNRNLFMEKKGLDAVVDAYEFNKFKIKKGEE